MQFIHSLKKHFSKEQLMIILTALSLSTPFYICVPFLLLETLYLLYTKKIINAFKTTPKSLCALEFKALFKDKYVSKCYLTNKDYSVDRSVFIKAKIDIWQIDKDFDNLISKVDKLHKNYADFKVIYLKNEITHVEYQDLLYLSNIHRIQNILSSF